MTSCGDLTSKVGFLKGQLFLVTTGMLNNDQKSGPLLPGPARPLWPGPAQKIRPLDKMAADWNPFLSILLAFLLELGLHHELFGHFLGRRFS
jgi:hypothetical protein